MNIYNEKNSAKAFLWSIILPQILVILLVSIFSVVYEDAQLLQEQMIYIISMMLVSQFAFFIIYLVFANKNNINIKTEVKRNVKKLNIQNMLFCMLISVIAVFGLYYVVSLFDELIYKIFGYVPQGGGLVSSNFGFFVLNVILTAIIPAVTEELVFRGIIFKGLKGKGFWFASITSAVMFMFVHLSLSSIIYPIIMGIIFCLVVKKTGSILYSMIVHFCNNFIVILIEYIQNISSKQLFMPLTLWWEKVIVFVVAIFAIVLIIFIINKCLKSAGNNEEWQITKEMPNNVVVINNHTKWQKIISYIKERRTTFYSLLIGFAFWLLIIITSLIA